MRIDYFSDEDRDFASSIDENIKEREFKNLKCTKTGYVIWNEDIRIGIITYSLLWEKIPFMNLIFINEKYRGKGFGSKAILEWENEMRKLNYKMTLVSTQVDENAQYLYRKLGYIDCGELLFENTPYDQPAELFLRKVL